MRQITPLQSMYTPEHLKRWKLPSSYMGAEWTNHYVFLGRHRDSDLLSESNFCVARKRLETLTDSEYGANESPWDNSGDLQKASRFVVRESHWAVGWVEWIAIHKDDEAALRLCDDMLSGLEDYPVLSEDDLSARESEAANQIWKDCYRVSDRIKYIREHRSQFEIHGLADMLACVRGQFFAGYDSELIH